jgi:hypothetical protein
MPVSCRRSWSATAAGASREAAWGNYRNQANRQVCRPYLSMLNKLSIHPGRFGAAGEPLGAM